MSNYNGLELKDVQLPEGAMLMARVDCVMYMHDGDIAVASRCDDGNGERPGLVTLLGLVEMAKKNIVETHYNKAEWVGDEDE